VNSSSKNIYFLSDFHLGTPNAVVSLQREKKIIRFLESVQNEAAEIFIVGDMFDFWYEYKYVVPKGYVRILGKLAMLTDAGIKIHFFVGNHDMWMRNYFQKELNIPVYFEPRDFTFGHRLFLVGHGDGLGPGDKKYKFLKKIFRNPVCQWLFSLVPAGIGMWLANYFSNKSRDATPVKERSFMGEENEWLISYCKEVLQKKHYDYFVFGHRHLPIDFDFKNGSRYINIGDWIRHFTYAVWDGETIKLETFEE
jgi:UDP-2,3-diacylglucosamine hydrolase